MEVDGGADSRKKLDLRKMRSQSRCETLRNSRIWMRISNKTRKKSGSKSWCKSNELARQDAAV